MFEDYLNSLHTFLQNNSYIREYSITTRFDDDAKALILNIKANLEINFIFHGFEYLKIKDGRIFKDKYRYHFNNDKNEYYRWDNAPHHRDIDTFPHHFHKNNEILESEEITIEKVFKNIIHYL